MPSSLTAITAPSFVGATLTGVTTSAGNLTLQSTSHATKGKILFGTSAYDEANNRLGLANSSPSYTLDVNGAINIPTTSSTVGIVFQNGTRFIHTYGTGNIFIGPNSGNFTLTSASGNVSLGANTLTALTTGVNNFALGSSALAAATSGGGNVALGPYCLTGLSTGSSNIAIGYQAGYYVNGAGNILLGFNAGLGITTEDNNIYLGNSAWQGTGGGNIVIGGAAGLQMAGGYNNVIIGTYAAGFGGGGTSATGCVVLGTSAFNSLQANGNVGIGSQAGYAVTTANNTFIGYQAGYSDGTTATLTSGSNMAAIGYNAQVAQSNSLVLGGLTANGFGVKVGINTTTPSAKLHVVETTEQLRLGYDGSNYCNVTVGSSGEVVINAVGSGARFKFSDIVNIPTKTPSSASDTGTTGDIGWDASYLYVCTATDTWKRVALASW